MSTQSPAEIVLQQIEDQMHCIEGINMRYNKVTNFGQFPNGQESYIEHMLVEWDHLKCRREKLKQLMTFEPAA